MGKVYYSQVDSRWKNHKYPSPSLPNATVGSGGCGPTSAAMIVSSIAQVITPDAMADWSRSHGYRVNGGTADGLFQAVANNWGIEFARPKSTFEMADYCKNGWCVAVKVGAGQFTTGGHFIVVMGVNGNNEFQVFDPYLYNGKFNSYGRAGKGRLEGTTYWIDVQKFKDNANAKAFFAFKFKEQVSQPTQNKPKYNVGQKVVFSSHYDNPDDTVEKAHFDTPYNTGIICWVQAGSRQQYLIDTGTFQAWINEGDIRSLAEQTQQVASFEPYKATITANPSLTVRKEPRKDSDKISSIVKNGIITILEESGDWGRIDKGWVCLRENGKAYVSKQTSASAKPQATKSTVGQKKAFKASTTIRENSNMTGAVYTYKAGTTVLIQENIGDVDKIKVILTGRIGYVKNNSYR